MFFKTDKHKYKQQTHKVHVSMFTYDAGMKVISFSERPAFYFMTFKYKKACILGENFLFIAISWQMSAQEWSASLAST